MDDDTTNHAKFLLLSHLIFGSRVPQKAFERQFIPEAEDIEVFLPPFYKTAQQKQEMVTSLKPKRTRSIPKDNIAFCREMERNDLVSCSAEQDISEQGWQHEVLSSKVCPVSRSSWNTSQ